MLALMSVTASATHQALSFISPCWSFATEATSSRVVDAYKSHHIKSVMAAICNMFTTLFPLLFTHFVSFKPPYGGGTIFVNLLALELFF